MVRARRADRKPIGERARSDHVLVAGRGAPAGVFAPSVSRPRLSLTGRPWSVKTEPRRPAWRSGVEQLGGHETEGRSQNEGQWPPSGEDSPIPSLRIRAPCWVHEGPSGCEPEAHYQPFDDVG